MMTVELSYYVSKDVQIRLIYRAKTPNEPCFAYNNWAV
jgi:hypothetical protein